MKKPTQRQQPEQKPILTGWSSLTVADKEIVFDMLRDPFHMLQKPPEVMAMYLWALGAFPEYETCLALVQQSIRENFPAAK